jgi:hypothetical protein
MVELNYGKYPVPKTLMQVIELKKDLNEKGLLPFGDLLGYYFAVEDLDSRYLNTPLDLIAFARPGVDGIHYGFLTDFGLVEDLEEAYIVRVTPMDFDDPVKIVARNLRDFMRMVCYSPISLHWLDMNSSAEQCEKAKQLDAESLQDADSMGTREVFKKDFQLEPIEDIYSFLKSVQNERAGKIVLPTGDGIGIVNKSNENQSHHLFAVSRDQSLEFKEVKRFFESATLEAKLAFLRDAQSFGLLMDCKDMKLYLRDQLIAMGLKDEAERIMHPDL